MSVVIRLNRVGTKNKPKYRIQVADQRRCLGGSCLEIIGHFNPKPKGQEKKIDLDLGKAKDWIAKGAQPTNRVKSLIKMAEAGDK